MAASPETQSLKGPGIAAAIAAAVAWFTPGGQPAAAAFTTFAVSYGLQAWSMREARKASLQDVAERKNSIRSAQSPHRMILGQVQTSGPLIYGQVTGAEKEYFHSIIPLAAHACHSVGDGWIEDQRTKRDGTGAATTGAYAGLIRTIAHLGADDQVADATLVAESAGQWTSTDRGRGHTYVYSRKKFDQDKLYILPNERYHVRGLLAYDPRDGATRLTENPALLLRLYLRASWGINASGAEVDDDLAAAAADICDEWIALDAAISIAVTADPATDEFTAAAVESRLNTGDRLVLAATSAPAGVPAGTYYAIRTGPQSFALADTYQHALEGTSLGFTTAGSGVTFGSIAQRRYTVNGSITLDQHPREIVLDLLAAMAGTITFSAGKFRIYAGAYLAPDESRPITLADTRGDAVINPTRAHFERTNQVRGAYTDPAHGYVVTSYPAVGNSAYVTEDDGEVIERPADFPFCDSPYRAQRLAKIILEKSRAERITLPCKIRALRFATCETVRVTIPEYGIDGVYRILGWRLAAAGDASLGVDLSLEAETEAQYTWSAAEAVNPAPTARPDVPTAATDVAAPPSLALASGNAELLEAADGTIISRIRATWTTAPEPARTGYEIQYKRAADSAWITLTAARDANQTWCAPVEDGETYTVRVRTIAAPGARRSAWIQDTELVEGKTAAPTAPSALSVMPAPGGFDIAWSANPDADYSRSELWEATSNNRAAAYLIFDGKGNRFARTGLGGSVTRWYWVIDYDRSGNASAWYPVSATGGVSATTASPGGGIPVVADATAITAGSGSPPPGGDAYWAVFSDHDGKIWRWSEILGAYTAAADGADILANTIAANKLAVAQLAAIAADLGAINAGSIDIGSGKFSVDPSGNVTIRSATSGERLEITNSRVRVYDASGTLRVKIGNLA